MRELLETKVNIIWEKLGVPISDSDTYFFGDDKKGDYTDSAQRDELIDWLSRRAADYERTLREVFAQEE